MQQMKIFLIRLSAERSRISFKILNALMKKYGTLEEVVIEMPRDQNSEEQKEMGKRKAKEKRKRVGLY